jgi:hypothetical protein
LSATLEMLRAFRTASCWSGVKRDPCGSEDDRSFDVISTGGIDPAVSLPGSPVTGDTSKVRGDSACRLGPI